MLSDVETPTGTCFQDEVSGGVCVPIDTIKNQLNGINQALYSESAAGTVTLVLFRDCGSSQFPNECTTLNLISDGAGTGEVPETAAGVPEFGVPTMLVVVVGVVAVSALKIGRARSVSLKEGRFSRIHSPVSAD